MRFLPGHRLGFLDKLILHLFFISVIIYSSLVSSFLGAAFVFFIIWNSLQISELPRNDGPNEGNFFFLKKMMTKMMKK